MFAPIDASELAILEEVLTVTLDEQTGIKVALAASCLPEGLLQLYDLSGRLVFEKLFEHECRVSESIQDLQVTPCQLIPTLEKKCYEKK